MNATLTRITLLVAALLASATIAWADDEASKPIPIAEIKRDTPVDFAKEIAPILAKKCAACHNATEAESDLSLETPETIHKGGVSGPAIEPGKAMESLLLLRASGQEEPLMPPPDNKVAAEPLTSEELGLLKLWIDGGATGEAGGPTVVEWNALPAGVNPIYAVALTRDGQFAACSRGNQLFVYHLPTQQLVGALADPNVAPNDTAAHLDLVHSLAFSPDGYTLASGGFRTVKIWRRPHNPRALELAGPGGEDAPVMAVSSDGRWLATGGSDALIRLWDLHSNAPPRTLAGHTGAITGLSFEKSGARLLSTGEDGSLRAWRTAEGAPIARLDSPNPIRSVALTDDASRVFTSGSDGVLRVWRAPQPASPAIDVNVDITALTVSPDRATIAIACADGQTRIIDAASGAASHTFTGRSGAATAVAFQAGGSLLATAGRDGTVQVWDVSNRSLSRSHAAPAADGSSTRPELTSVAISSDGTRIIAGGVDGLVRMWSSDGAETVIGSPGAPIVEIEIRADGSLFYAASADGVVRAYDGAGESKLEMRHSAAIRAMALSPDGNWLATAGEDRLVRVWKAADGVPARADWGGFSGPINSLAFSPDSARLVAGGEVAGEVLIFNLPEGTAEQAFRDDCRAIVGLGFAGAAGDQVVAAGADQTVRRWPIAALRGLDAHEQEITAIATIPGSADEVLTASIDGSARRWKLTTGEMVKAFEHGGPILAIAVRPDGKFFATAGADKITKLWNMETSQPVATIRGDLRSQDELFQTVRAANLAKDKSAFLAQALAEIEARREAEKNALTSAAAALTASEQALAEKTTAAQKAAEEKAAAEKAAKETAEQAKAAEEAKAAAEQALAAAKAEAEQAAAAKAAADQAAAEAQAKLDAAQKAAAEAAKAAEEKAAAAKQAADAIAAKAKAATDTEAARAASETAKVAAARAKEVATVGVQRAEEAVAAAKAKAQEAEAAAKKAAEIVATVTQQAAASEAPAASVDFSPDNRTFAVAAADKCVRTYDATTGAPLEVYEGHSSTVRAVRYLDARRLASSGVESLPIIWNTTPAWELAATIGSADSTTAFVDRVTAIAFSPDGKLMATGGGEPSRSGELKLWKTDDWSLAKDLKEAHSDVVTGLDFSADGMMLASSATDKFVKVHNVDSGALAGSFEGHTHHVLDVSWRSNGRVLASSSADNTIKVWNFVTGEQQRTISGFGKEVTSISYIGDTGLVVTGAGDSLVRLSNTDDGALVRSFSGASDYTYSVATSFDGKIVVAGGHDSVLRVWNGETAQLLLQFKPPEAKPETK